ncbi:MmcQ/YjbR family DNA-binding protein [Streptococcus entericus]|uniref:MmcQ/YjbR family DNA-binding protein n=1 Tax=Streptococcus entericus TaxID=155680 RepID=UPI0003781853|nr:MmcQ/YjbR family DNA-binding protein [Streptococcus entericus]
MSIQDKIDFCIAEGEKLTGARVYYREDWECYYFDVAGKFFGLLSNHSEKGSFITLKNLPGRNEVLRSTYKSIVPGYYTNKAHWNSIDVTTDEVSQDMLAALIETSYQLVVAKLPKKIRDTI